MLSRSAGLMSRVAARRTSAIARHMSSSSTQTSEPLVRFEANAATRTYILNRPSKLNALNSEMIVPLRSKVEEWDKADLCKLIIGRGEGKAFCAGGDVATVAEQAANEQERPKAIDFFKKEFETDYALAALEKPYVAVMDGITMGGGFGLSMHAPFRIATDKTIVAMPETKIGYAPDVGASHFLSRLDGQLGTYLGMTSEFVYGHNAFELGLATHYVPSSRVPHLLDALAVLEEPTLQRIDATIHEFYDEPTSSQRPNIIKGAVRAALDSAFSPLDPRQIVAKLTEFAKGGYSVSQQPEEKAKELEAVKKWAQQTVDTLNARSPTSLVVAREAIAKGKKSSLGDALKMELSFATAWVNGAGPDFQTGIRALLIDKILDRPAWSPSTIEDIKEGEKETIIKHFFASDSQYIKPPPTLEVAKPDAKKIASEPHRFGLPTEEEIKSIIVGEHASSGDFGLNVDEVVAKSEKDLKPPLKALTRRGIKEKVMDVIGRRCEVAEEGRWVKWK